MAFYGIPVDFTTSVLHGWKLGKEMCNATGFLLTLSGNHLSCYEIVFRQLNSIW